MNFITSNKFIKFVNGFFTTINDEKRFKEKTVGIKILFSKVYIFLHIL